MEILVQMRCPLGLEQGLRAPKSNGLTTGLTDYLTLPTSPGRRRNCSRGGASCREPTTPKNLELLSTRKWVAEGSTFGMSDEPKASTVASTAPKGYANAASGTSLWNQPDPGGRRSKRGVDRDCDFVVLRVARIG